jgi:hypothetical protein
MVQANKISRVAGRLDNKEVLKKGPLENSYRLVRSDLILKAW